MKTYLSIIVLTILLTCSGCIDGLWKRKPKPPFIPLKHNTPKDIGEAQKVVEESTKTIKEATASIVKEATVIQVETSQVEDKIPEEIKPQISSHLEQIGTSSASIIKDANEINIETAKLTGATALLNIAKEKAKDTENSIKILEKERDKALKERNDAIKAKNSALHRALRWLVISSIVGASALGVFGFMYRSKIALTLSAICITIMSVAIFITTYFVYIVIFGAVVLIGLVGVIIYNIIEQRKALSETIDTVEIVKMALSKDKKEEIFGGEGQSGIMDSIQSPSTINLIKSTKEKMSNLWKYTKNKKEEKDINQK